MTNLPNPWVSALTDHPPRSADCFESALASAMTADEVAAAPEFTDSPDAAAEPLDDAVAHDIWATLDKYPRGFDPERFLADIEDMPTFLSAPRPEYLRAAEMIPILAVLAGY